MAAPKQNAAPIIGQFIVLVVTCFFAAIVTYRWLMHQFPSSSFVLLMVAGMTVVGAVAGFTVSALANIAFRAGPPKLRVPFTAIIWLALCAAITKWLLDAGADPNRTIITAALAAVSGLLVGTLNAELIVGLWFYRRKAKLRESRQPVARD